MKTLQGEAAQAAKMKSAMAAAREGFTASELDAAEQLLHLSESSASSGNPRAAARRGHDAFSAASGSSSSPRSVNAPPAPGAFSVRLFLGPTVHEGEDEHEVAGRQRRVRRYRLIAEIYDATEEIGGCSGHKKKE